MGPDKAATSGEGQRKAIETGDPDFPIVYEATAEEMQTLKQFGF